MLFFDKHMTTNYIHIGTLNDNSQDHHREMTVNVPAGTNVSELVRAFFSKDAEDIQAEEVQPNKQDYFPLLTEQCRKEGKIERVEAELSTACKGSAAWLWSVIHTNEALGYIATNHLDAQDVYNAFTDYFGELPYNVRNFRGARNKK